MPRCSAAACCVCHALEIARRRFTFSAFRHYQYFIVNILPRLIAVITVMPVISSAHFVIFAMILRLFSLFFRISRLADATQTLGHAAIIAGITPSRFRAADYCE